MDFTIIAQYLDIRTLTHELKRVETWTLYTFGAVDKSAFHLIEIYTVNSIIHFSKKSALEILADNRGFGKYRKIPKISPSMYKPPKPATQKSLR